ncbi:hypothetical protein TTHERM_00625970 (macronuclear) [Tetrahymena thermophila SB210]|uniref:Uncharacterized protein n=1 Tax=Tetrahymena thermophila (strain SB210) TaxID=312017 RepID=Q23S03_TETTS|nr:hypothetical protein TTHERM_00625970 [Tetrahymena thermophila SB210]EAR99236.2 hypothetical protein TTHERM_00625970 [Tetrahymena thermophila SB210]|eukprot:XP_001019481.2 hypothetical protein TTHERM_00625970 [Tetrahymena thermophila SB210]
MIQQLKVKQKIKVIMINIESLKELDSFSSRFSQQIVEITSLKISLKNQKINELCSLTKLINSLPNLTMLILHFEKTDMNNTLVNALQNAISERKLKDVTIHLLGNNITHKKAKQFLLFIKEMYPQVGGYNYQYNKGRVMVSNSSSLLKIDFQYSEKQSIFLDDLQSKIFSFEIKSNQIDFVKIIQQNIQNKIDNCHVSLSFKQK